MTHQIMTKQEFEDALKRIKELRRTEPNAAVSNEINELLAKVKVYENQAQKDRKTWEAFFNGEPTGDFPTRGFQHQKKRENFD